MLPSVAAVPPLCFSASYTDSYTFTAAARLQFSAPELRFGKKFRHPFAVKSVFGADSISSSLVDEPRKEIVHVEPVYEPTPPNRPIRTPHSGYHFDGTSRKFFEGWYFKVSIPECRQSFCFMYSVENPAFRKKLSTLEEVQYGPRFTGVGAQILGADDKYICQYTEESQNFWGSMSLCNKYINCYCLSTNVSVQRKLICSMLPIKSVYFLNFRGKSNIYEPWERGNLVDV